MHPLTKQILDSVLNTPSDSPSSPAAPAEQKMKEICVFIFKRVDGTEYMSEILTDEEEEEARWNL